jgi:ADP-ribose pyrophosphatase YjhB (NUDIX family)
LGEQPIHVRLREWAANSVVPSVTVVIRDDQGRVLLIHKIDNDLWALPGGGHDAGERITDTAVREVNEETGLDVEVVRLVGTYTNPHHVMAYDDGEVRQQFSLCFEARWQWHTARGRHGNQGCALGRPR